MKNLIIAIYLILSINIFSATAENPKREFRGAWLHTVGQNHFAQRDRRGNMEYLRDQLDKMQKAGVNAVIFQVRPVADAFYYSELEPWSKYLTGTVGDQPREFWDPLQFVIEECHSRGMELHAWLNPYRSVPVDEVVPFDHQTRTHPERYVVFNKRYYFDPGLQENRDFIAEIVKDIVDRYDVDAIHMDDYFYPYPVKGLAFPDDDSYARYGKGLSREDWRRDNVNRLIEQLCVTIRNTKPWVRFGISPFGIWRNISSDPKGSRTNGLQNYDDLYADVVLWAKEGWIDYQAPQLYWELDHKLASSRILADWWNKNGYGRHMYFGQDVNKTMDLDELGTKVDISRRLENVQGNVWWPSVSITNNYKNVADSLSLDKQSTVALTPEYPWLDNSIGLKLVPSPINVSYKEGTLYWDYDNVPTDNLLSTPSGIVVYRIDGPMSPENCDDPENILAVVRGQVQSWQVDEKIEPGTWLVVTTLDHLNRESQPSEPVCIE